VTMTSTSKNLPQSPPIPRVVPEEWENKPTWEESHLSSNVPARKNC